MFVVDTNILVYAADKSTQEHSVCREKLEHWRRRTGIWYLTWGIVYEFVRVVTHQRVLRNPWTAEQAWQFIAALLVAPSCAMLIPGERHEEVARALFEEYPLIRGNLVHDAHTVALMREHGIVRIVTRDADFRRFGVQVEDPLSP